ncbi:MAG TPA: GNAT family N-acetyltransferase [Acidobacteriaceae bacterium]|jgi:ribosomal protein S18 acetylase RimI-like enzyme|nr:GNAT family N-acetyltransferase [Acidobacteriaceae bacterium]
MSSVPVASEIEVLDLRHFSARQLRPLLEREAGLWQDRLRWDYRSSTELLLKYLESRILQGFAALDRGRVCGYTFCVYEGAKAVLGDAFATGHRTMSDADATRALLVPMLEMLRHTPGVDRVESQLLMFDAGEFADLFAGPEFTIYPRLFLECDLGGKRESLMADALVDPLSGVPEDLELSLWTAEDYQAAAELIYTCYVGHSDTQINDQYRSLHGSLRFLHNIVRFPGCGVFESCFSWMLRERQSGALVGMVLCSRVGAGVAHITQLCVAQAYRGRGLGRGLLQRNAQSLVRAGFDAITLTVTEVNDSAVRLYERFGFAQRHRFDAMVMEPRLKPR